MALDDLGCGILATGPIAAIAKERCEGFANWKQANTRTCSRRRTRWLRRTQQGLELDHDDFGKWYDKSDLHKATGPFVVAVVEIAEDQTAAFLVVGPDMPANILTRSHRSWRHSEPRHCRT